MADLSICSIEELLEELGKRVDHSVAIVRILLLPNIKGEEEYAHYRWETEKGELTVYVPRMESRAGV